jgi:hypothetical protein
VDSIDDSQHFSGIHSYVFSTAYSPTATANQVFSPNISSTSHFIKLCSGMFTKLMKYWRWGPIVRTYSGP